MQTSQKKHGGNVWEASEKTGRKVEDILDYSANISPLGTPPGVKDAIMNTLDSLIHYPDPDSLKLRDQLSKKLAVNLGKIIVGNGSAELIYLLIKALKPKRTLLLHPTFSEYEFAIRSFEGEIELLELKEENGFRLQVDDVLDKLPDVDLVFICNPNNPTGCLTKKDSLKQIIEHAKRDNTFVVIDEAFMDFVAQSEKYSIMDLLPYYDNLFILRSLTKFYALPGLRIGAAFGPEALIEKMNDLREPWTVNSLAQAAAEASLNDEEYANRLQELIWEEQRFLYKSLNELPGFNAYPPSVNYIFIDISKTKRTSTEWTEKMAEEGVLVRNCNTYPFLGEKYLRTAVRGHKENMCLLDAFKKCLRKFSSKYGM